MEAVTTRTPAALAAWAFVGVLWAIAVLGVASVGIYVAPVAIVATAAVSHAVGRRGLLALPVAAAAAAVTLLVPFLVSGEHGERGGGSSAVPPPSAP
ncbi:MAG TPA: hypothetical protein VM307_08240 [Egibacteraceae bacterium]|nr:hypothetical protein [Egibacteraceae bacterium]